MKNNMKKVLSLLLVLVMVFALAACGGNKTEEPKDDAGSKTEENKDNKDGEKLAKVVFMIATATSIIALGFIIYFIFSKSIPTISKIGLFNFIGGKVIVSWPRRA